MPLKDILVHVDASKAGENRVNAAAELAAKQEANLIGLFVERKRKYTKEESEKAEVMFIDHADRANVFYEWRSVEGHPGEIIRTHAKYCDLLVLGQSDSEIDLDMGDYPDGIILSAGRPVLVIPRVGKVTSIGERVMIGWDGSAQASRAVHDALPLMKNAEMVNVISINPNTTGDHGEEPCADICRHLARHGIKVEAQSMNVDDIGIADMLLSRASDKGIDLFVVGAYGHARWRELILGGVTAHMLEHMTRPVLMTH
ncbi:MAG TPA: universal stress protein [Rhodospirillales bacterium]|jgi:nucleotide-binding universal stress UspA family protein|nr:universal stress protein [Rhodospirillales bacterium]HIL76022.1 universal stress protein [Rhodospirillales bacterium]